MLTDHIQEEMTKAKYKNLEDSTFYGKGVRFQGVGVNDKNLEECRKSLQEVLKEWVLLKERASEPLPAVNGKKLKFPTLTHA